MFKLLQIYFLKLDAVLVKKYDLLLDITIVTFIVNIAFLLVIHNVHRKRITVLLLVSSYV